MTLCSTRDDKDVVDLFVIVSTSNADRTFIVHKGTCCASVQDVKTSSPFAALGHCLKQARAGGSYIGILFILTFIAFITTPNNLFVSCC